MKLHERSAGYAAEWLKRARSNLALAKARTSEEIYLEDLCFELQQAAEKSLKAVLIAKHITFRFVHDLAELMTLLDQNGVEIPSQIRQAASLTDYSVEARYPGPFEAVTPDEYKEALGLAENVVAWAETCLADTPE